MKLIDGENIQASSVYTIEPKTSNVLLTIYSGEEKLVSILRDGSHRFYNSSKIDEAARIFWNSVSTYFACMQSPDYTLILLEELERLRKDAFELQCLTEGGVDNWHGYSESLQTGGYFDKYD